MSGLDLAFFSLLDWISQEQSEHSSGIAATGKYYLMICELQHAHLSDSSYSECSIVSIVECDKIKKTCHNKHLFNVV